MRILELLIALLIQLILFAILYGDLTFIFERLSEKVQLITSFFIIIATIVVGFATSDSFNMRVLFLILAGVILTFQILRKYMKLTRS